MIRLFNADTELGLKGKRVVITKGKHKGEHGKVAKEGHVTLDGRTGTLIDLVNETGYLLFQPDEFEVTSEDDSIDEKKKTIGKYILADIGVFEDAIKELKEFQEQLLNANTVEQVNHIKNELFYLEKEHNIREEW